MVFNVGLDPVGAGLVESLNRPGGNMTGASFFSVMLAAKRLGLLRELIPKADLVAILVNPSYPDVEIQMRDAQAAARDLGCASSFCTHLTNPEIDAAFAEMVKQRVGGLIASGDPFFDSRPLPAFSGWRQRHAIPAVYHLRDYATGGGLMSYSSQH